MSKKNWTNILLIEIKTNKNSNKIGESTNKYGKEGIKILMMFDIISVFTESLPRSYVFTRSD